MSRSRSAEKNRVRNWTSYGQRTTVALGMPELRQVETTSVCNLRCVFCPYDAMTRARHHMDIDRFRELLNRKENRHLSEIALHHFGEPFLQANFAEFVKFASDLGISTVVSSNMTRLSPKMAHDVLAAGLSRLIVSIDAAEPETYEKLRVRGKLEDVEANLHRLLAVKNELKSDIFIQVQFIATPENHDEVEAFESRWLAEPGIDQVVIRRERTHAGQVIRHDEYDSRDEARQPCRYLWESVVVTQDGTVVPCCKDFDARVPLGNAFDESLEEIWNGPKMQNLRQAHVDGRFEDNELCSNCSEWRGDPPFSAEEAPIRVQEFKQMKSDFRAEPRHMRVWE